MENSLKNIHSKANARRWMSEHELKSFLRKYNLLSGVSIGLGVVSGLLSTIALNLGVEKYLGFVVSGATIAYFTSVCEGMLRSKEYETKIFKLRQQGMGYTNLMSNISRQLNLDREDREMPDAYHRWISKAFDDLERSALHYSESTNIAFKEYCDLNGISNPLDIHDLLVRDNSSRDEGVRIIVSRCATPHLHTSPQEDTAVEEKRSVSENTDSRDRDTTTSVASEEDYARRNVNLCDVRNIESGAIGVCGVDTFSDENMRLCIERETPV